MEKIIKRPLAIFLAVVMFMAMLFYFPGETFRSLDWGLWASAEEITPSAPTEGDGSEENPYQISTAAELYWFAGLVNGDASVCDYDEESGTGTQQNTDANAVLTADITVNEGTITADSTDVIPWTPIGKDSINTYFGTFDGQGCTISGLYFNDPEADYAGLFGCAAGSISNVTVSNSYFGCRYYTGGICGYNSGGTISGCTNTATVSGSVNDKSNCSFRVGGICGYNSGGTISGCTNTGTVGADMTADTDYINCYFGGICGYDGPGNLLQKCANTGKVFANYKIKGFYNEYSGGDDNTNFSSTSRIGGICGYSASNIENCSNIGDVSYSLTFLDSANAGGTPYLYGSIGGICGYSDFKSIVNSYSAGNVSQTITDKRTGGTYSDNMTYDNFCGYGASEFMNCYLQSEDSSESGDPMEDAASVILKTAAEFASGEVCYLLNGFTSEDELVWGQTIGTDPYPVLGGAEVYNAPTYEGCPGKPGEPTGSTYSNKEAVYEEHTYDENGFCTICGGYEPATLTADKYDIDGDGSNDTVYEISNAGQLYWFAALVNGDTTHAEFDAQNTAASAVLTADIVVNSNLLGSLNENGTVPEDITVRSWAPIGGYYNNSFISYTGTFDGQNHTVSGLHFNSSTTSCVGLFGSVGSSGSVSNVGVEDSYFNGGEGVGGVCGHNAGTITNCYNTSAINGSGSYIGGVCGVSDGTITNCYHTGAVNVTGESNHFGGVCGGGNGTITNCYYDSTVYSGEAVGDDNGSSINVEGKTTDQFNSGEVAYLLSQGCTVNDITYDGSIWGQEIGTDPYPVLGGATVYLTTGCVTYNNTLYDGDKPHVYEDGVCIDCGMLDPVLENKDYPIEVGYTGKALVAPAAENFTYSGAGELTFTWFDGEAELDTPPTNVGEYTLVATIGESGDYGADSIVIDVKIVKGTPEYDVPVVTATYGDTLKDVELPEGFTWQDEETTSIGNAGEHTFKVTFTPTDTDNYNVVEDIEITINVAKADPTVAPTIEDKTYSEGDDIPAISTGEEDTSGTIKWLDVQLKALEAGENILTWEFTPTDEENYNVVTGTMIIAAETTTTTTATTTTTTTTTSETETSDTKTETSSVTETTDAETETSSVTETSTASSTATSGKTTSKESSATSAETTTTASSATTSDTTTSKVSSTTTSSVTSTTASETATSAGPTNTTTSDTTDTTSKTTETTTTTTTSETVTSAGPTNTTTSDTTTTTSETTTTTTTSETVTSAGPTSTTTSSTTNTTSNTTETTTTASDKTTASTTSDSTTTATSTSTTVTTTSTTTSTETTTSTTFTETTSATVSATTDSSGTTTTSDTTETTTDTTNTTDTTTTTTDTTTTTGTEKSFLKGDANGDGIIDADDAYIVLVYYAENMVGREHTMFDDLEVEIRFIEAMDIDQDGDLDANDAYLILLYYARVSEGVDVTWEELTK